jgi:hypothetical protein
MQTLMSRPLHLLLPTLFITAGACAPPTPTNQSSAALTTPPKKSAYAVLLCRPSDKADLHDTAYYTKLFTSAGSGTGNVIDYWKDQSFGNLDLSGNTLLGPFDTGVTLAGAVHTELPGDRRRSQRIQDCINAASATVSLDSYYSVVAVYNVGVDLGSASANLPDGAGGQRQVGAVIADLNSSMTTILHEMGHSMGFAHSRSTQAVSCDPNNDSTPGAYCDGFDIMSAANVFSMHGALGMSGCTSAPRAGNDPCQTGPGLDAWNRFTIGWLPTNEQEYTTPTGPYKLAALNHPEVPGVRLLRIPQASDGSAYTFEFLRADNWYAGIGTDRVVVHHLTESPLASLLDITSGGPTLRQGDRFGTDAWNVTVTNIDSAHSTATIQLSYGSSCTRTCSAKRVCMVNGHQVLPGPDDDPNSWCTDAGGHFVTRQVCSCN